VKQLSTEVQQQSFQSDKTTAGTDIHDPENFVAVDGTICPADGFYTYLSVLHPIILQKIIRDENDLFICSHDAAFTKSIFTGIYST